LGFEGSTTSASFGSCSRAKHGIAGLTVEAARQRPGWLNPSVQERFQAANAGSLTITLTRIGSGRFRGGAATAGPESIEKLGPMEDVRKA